MLSNTITVYIQVFIIVYIRLWELGICHCCLTVFCGGVRFGVNFELYVCYVLGMSADVATSAP